MNESYFNELLEIFYNDLNNKFFHVYYLFCLMYKYQFFFNFLILLYKLTSTLKPKKCLKLLGLYTEIYGIYFLCHLFMNSRFCKHCIAFLFIVTEKFTFSSYKIFLNVKDDIFNLKTILYYFLIKMLE